MLINLILNQLFPFKYNCSHYVLEILDLLVFFSGDTWEALNAYPIRKINVGPVDCVV